MRLFLTGATGFVGRNMVVRAAQRGWTVLAPVRDAAKLGRLLHEDGVTEGTVEPLPADPASWPDPLPVDAAVHAAGALFERHLGDFLETNLRWTMAALARLPARCPAIVLSSQSAGGPTPPQAPARNERMADEPVSAYGESKLRMERAIGEFVAAGTPLVSVVDSGGLDDETTAELNAVYVLSRQRTVQQDAAFGIRQIVDIALKALSPGINDTTTAVMCVDYLAAILVRIAVRRMPTSHRLDQGGLRGIARGPSFESLLAEAFDQIRQNAAGNVAILSRMLGALQTIASLTTSPSRRAALREQVQSIAELAERTVKSPYDRERFESRLVRVYEALEAEPVLFVRAKKD